MTTPIRASMLPSYPDCPRRAAAKALAREIADAGHSLRETAPSVGAAMGTAVHAAAAEALRRKRDGETAETDQGVERALEEFRAETEPGAVWDDSSPDRRTAEAQIQRQVRAYVTTVVPLVDPVLIETPLEADAGDGFKLTGHLDLFTADGAVRDLKTGAVDRPYSAQLGAYALLLRSHGHTPKTLVTDWIKRTRLKAAQPAPVPSVHDRALSERAAAENVQHIKQSITAWREAGRDDPSAFLANPMSLMCSEKFCPAHGTTWCAFGRKANG